AASGVDRNAGSAVVFDVLRCDARGAAIAPGRVIPKSTWLTSICSTVVMIVEPPGEPNATTGRPCDNTIVGLMLLRGRFPGPGELASPGVNSKSVSSLLSRNPRPGTTMPLPPICSIVKVYETTLPKRSLTVRCVVDELNGEGSPGATGTGRAVGPMRARRCAA